jgi:hypothetical protein
VLSLSRSEKIVKTALLEGGEIENLLVELLNDKYIEVLLYATSALCNIALDFKYVIKVLY